MLSVKDVTETRPSPIDRLIIQRIVAENFKSYAGRQEIGPFHKSFSSIVGPNGSGKSNVVDAIMFVLGYRAKKMRQTKLSDLIHISEGYTELDSCTVEVHFIRIRDLEGDNYEVIPNSELIVARTAWRNNRNVYTINGVNSSYGEVTLLLRTQGIDLDHKRFLILQGEVEAIALMKPKGSTEHEEGLLEYLEDIIGTNQYIPLIEETAKQLDGVNAVHSDKMLRVRAAERECGALVGEKEEAELFLRQENTKTERRSEFLQASIWKARKELQELKLLLEEKKAKLTKERERNIVDAEKADEIDNSIKSATKEAAELEKQVRKLQAELSLLEQNDVKMQETRKHLKNKLKSLSKSSSDGAKQESELTRSIEDNAVTIERLERDLDEKRVELGVATVELDKISGSLKGVTAKYQTELDARQNELLPFQEELRMVQAELDVSRSALDMVESKGKVDAKEIAVLNTRRDRVRDEISEAERKKTILGKQRLALKAKIDQETESTKGLEAERKNRAKQLQLLQSTTAEAMAALQQGDSGSAVCKAVIKESRAGRIRGIHGRLGDLGAIDAKYDVAIATACGYLDHIVVENTEVGQKCIEFLRKNNIGRASFIVLDKMKPANRSPPADLPEGAIRLFDLVKLKDDRFINAMYFALTDTLVARNLEEAQRWAYGKRRWRVITLDGKLFEVSGTVSGGGQVRRGGMGAQIKEDGVTQEQVQLLQDQCRETQEELKQIANALAKGQLSLVECEEQLMRTEAELSLIEGLLRSLPAELEMIETNIASINQKSSIGLSVEDEKEIKKLNQQISAGEVKLSKIRSIMSPIEAALVEIQQKILDAGGIKFKVQRSKVEGLTEQVDNVERRLGELSKEKVTLEKRLMALKEGKRDEGAIEKVNVELAELDKKLKDATSKAINLHQEFNQLQKTLDERNDQVEELKASLETISKSVIKFRKVEYEFRCAIEADETRMVELEKMTVAYSAELQQLHLHHIDTSKPAPVLPIYEDERDLGEFVKNLSQIKQTIDGLVVRLERSLPNLKVLEEYREKEATLHEQQAELQTIEGQRDEVRAKYDDLCRKRLDEFMVGFRTISQRLKELYQLITMGGNAELELVDSLDPFSEGVLFSVMPPRKSWKNISNLSGGEKTLSSLALVFALHIYRPTPIYIMDEIDAALDFRNVSIVAHYIKERTKDAQFIVISLRNNMFELADRLVGIYKTWQRTKCVVLDPRQFHLPPITTE